MDFPGRSPALRALNTIPPYREQVKLEIISRYSAGEPHSVPLLCVHGADMGAWVWDEHFLPFFARHGFAAHAVSLRGHGRSEDRGLLHGSGLDDFVSDVDTAVAQIGALPVLIGHSMGDAVVQRYMRGRRLPGVVQRTGAYFRTRPHILSGAPTP